MKTYNDLFEFRTDLFSVAVPDHCSDLRIKVATSGDLNRTGEFLQCVYQARANASVELMQVVAGALGVFATNRFLWDEGVAARMRMALLRDAGEPAPEGMTWPDPSEDPDFSEPEPEFEDPDNG